MLDKDWFAMNKWGATWSFLTTLPAPKAAQQQAPQLAFMPWVGLLLGFIFYLSAWLTSFSIPLVGALLVYLTWLACTGFLHLDGLADISDALAAGHDDQDKFLHVLKSPEVGALAVVVLVVLIVSKLILLFALVDAEIFAPLLLIPAWARLGAAWWASDIPPLHEGLATWLLDAGEVNLMPWFIFLMFLSLLLAPMLLLAPLVLWAWHYFLQYKVGGMNGDGLGAGIEVCEAGLLLLCCLSL